MATFEQLYRRLVKSSLHGADRNTYWDDCDPTQLDCLLNPRKYPVIWRLEDCDCDVKEQENCTARCPFDAMKAKEGDGISIDPNQCVGCNICVDACKYKNLTSSKDIMPVLQALDSHEGHVYALVAPAFLGQFSQAVTPGKLRSALKKIGFEGMLEVALFADILTLKEALEFDHNITTESDYQLTSCCCPMWIAMIRKVYHELMPHVPGSVSPMVASGRTIKTLYPNSKTVFIGPCMAKKAEAREKDVADAVDFVLTFQEVHDIFEALEVNPSDMEDDDRENTSRAGRIYARAGGVSEAVSDTLKYLNPNRDIRIRTKYADGVPGCRAMLNELIGGKYEANFYEGMGCIGGCVGGPKAMINKEEGCENVNRFGDEALYQTPIENPYVLKLLEQLGFDTVEKLLENSDIFTRAF
ncbi:[Fe-Fe] hydrogenase large subunit C-terminal domain-containing protein [Clostridium aminobutyricum]|uniref:4Fe-4S binding protein n=1 Tax=Clostridium aminobutyricum TaxID=33953 RepID=A0A939DBM5_CLOAM|nr:[Fe-Fe] hydrogenase large subunit C-terminal domain-containing protein [Clostridium aminobutyricum]MBN7774288.1 4Fe-4S binding protein [Clostridium aminobutyricum]